MKWNRGSTPSSGSKNAPDDAILDEAAIEVSLEEMREFLEADLVDVHADPEFKYTLRQRLWELVQARNRGSRH